MNRARVIGVVFMGLVSCGGGNSGSGQAGTGGSRTGAGGTGTGGASTGSGGTAATGSGGTAATGSGGTAVGGSGVTGGKGGGGMAGAGSGGIVGGAGGGPCTLPPLVQDKTLNYDVRAVNVSGAITLAGAQLPNGSTRGTITFVEAHGSTTSYDLADSGPGTYAVKLFPGTYDVTFSTNPRDGVSALPAGDSTQLASALSISADQTLNYDLHVVNVSGAITLGGAQLPDGSTRGTVTFVEAHGSTTQYDLTDSGPGTYSVKLFAGSYTVSFSTNPQDKVAALPAGDSTQLASALSISADQTLNYDLHVVNVSGAITLGGAQLPDGSTRGTVTFVEAHGSTTQYDLTDSGPGTYSVKLFAGSYTVSFSTNPQDKVAALPAGDSTQLASALSISADQTLNYDLHVVNVSGALTLAGAQLPDGSTRGTVTFVEAHGSTTDYTLTDSGPGTYSVKLFAGSYTVSFSTNPQDKVAALPAGDSTQLASALSISANQTLNYDLHVVNVSGALTLAGAQLPDGSTRGTVTFVEAHGSTTDYTLTDSGPATYSVKLFAGSYTVSFSTNPQDKVAALPAGDSTQLASALSVSADQTLNYDLHVVNVSGAITLAGAQLPDSPGAPQRGTITFSDTVSKSYMEYNLNTSGPGTYSVKLFAGSYSVSLSTPNSASLQGLPPGAYTILDVGCPR